MAVETSSSWPISRKAIWLDMYITTPGLKTDYRSAALPTVPTGPLNMRECMHICVRAWTCVCVCGRRVDGTDRGWRDGWIYMCTCVRACVRPCLRACDPVCEDGMIMLDQMDRWTDVWMDGLIDWLLNGCMDGLIYPRVWVLIRVVRQICMYVGRKVSEWVMDC